MNCAIAQALEALGDWWTLLIVREAFFGVRRFADFEANLGGIEALILAAVVAAAALVLAVRRLEAFELTDTD